MSAYADIVAAGPQARIHSPAHQPSADNPRRQWRRYPQSAVDL